MQQCTHKENYINSKGRLDNMENEEDASLEEIEKFKEVELEIDKDAFEVNEGTCQDCNEKLIKMVENRSILNGTISFHIIKLRCPKCGKEYLDLDQAEKYDFALLLEKATQQPISILTRKILS